MSGVSIYIEVGMEWDAMPAEIWPDGDAPTPVTAEAVKAAVEKAGGLRRVMRDWNLQDDLCMQITVRQDNPHWKGDDVLFGSPPPREDVTRAEVTR